MRAGLSAGERQFTLGQLKHVVSRLDDVGQSEPGDGVRSEGGDQTDVAPGQAIAADYVPADALDTIRAQTWRG